MKNILISFIRNDHFDLQKEENYKDLDITEVIQKSSINRLFLLTNKNREESINFKNWIAEKLDIEVKAVTLEKGSEKYILNKIESIIKYILLAEEGHARFFYLPGENTLQINLWEIVNQNIYKGKIIYPGNIDSQIEKVPAEPKKKTSQKPNESTSPIEPKIPVYNNLKEKKIFTIKAPEANPEISLLDKGLKTVTTGTNLLIWGEEGTGKQTLAAQVLQKSGKSYYQMNFRTVNPAKTDEVFQEISDKIQNDEFKILLLLNIEVLPSYIQERLADFKKIQIISTFNIIDRSNLEELNKRFYYLISSSMISIAPLRSKKEEIPQLINEIIKKHKSNAVISDNALCYINGHKWPGNLNELNSVISRACMETGSIITEEIIEHSIDNLENDLNQWTATPINENFKLNDILGDVAMHYIMQALEMAEGKKSKAARLLGFSNYQTLSNWIKKYQK